MQLSNAGLQKIIQREGIILHAYQDSVGVWTIGTGHTTAAGPPKVVKGMVITKAQNDQILMQDLTPVQQQVNAAVKVPLTQNQYDALVSIVFNCGPRFLTSTCIKRLNQKDYTGAAQAIMLWNKPAAIIGRRKSEQVQFNTPDPTASGHVAAGAVVVAGTAATAANYPHHYWPWIIGGGLLIIIAGVIISHFYNTRKVS